MRVFLEFHSNGIINQSTNATFIALVPKKSQTIKLSYSRPISLVTSLYKIILRSYQDVYAEFSMKQSLYVKEPLLKETNFGWCFDSQWRGGWEKEVTGGKYCLQNWFWKDLWPCGLGFLKPCARKERLQLKMEILYERVLVIN